LLIYAYYIFPFLIGYGLKSSIKYTPTQNTHVRSTFSQLGLFSILYTLKKKGKERKKLAAQWDSRPASVIYRLQ
jgi:hypothetical protein